MAQHLIVNITWQDNYWTGAPSEEDIQHAGHGYVRAGNVGNEYLNFNLGKNVEGGYKIGFFQATRQPVNFSNGEGYVFFYSKGYLVGVYGKAEIGTFKMTDAPDPNATGNIRAPIDWVCRFQDIRRFPFVSERHLGGKSRIGQVGFNYIDDATALAILNEAISLHPDESEYRAKLKMLRAELNPAHSDQIIPEISPDENGDVSNPTDAYFTPRTREIMAGLHAEPTKDYYLAHKTDLKTQVEEPFQQLMHNVAAQLPPAITEVMETEKKIFARILKNDYGQGGAWDFYWGAFYPKNGKRTQDTQLSMWMDYRFFECGFYIGAYGSESRQRFVRNCRTYYNQLLPMLEKALTQENLYFSRQTNLTVTDTGDVIPAELFTWQAWLKNPEVSDCDASIVIPWQKLLTYDRATLCRTVAQVHSSFFPLVLLATLDDPLPAIARYLGFEEEDDEPELQPEYPLAQMAVETGFDEATLSRWVRAIARKQQAVLYGPPGTGKTFVAERLARHLIGGGDGFAELVQFHPSYAYEDFMQGIRPETEDGQISYHLKPGRFMQFCEQARRKSGTCVLIIDEINRANLSRVFGELMYLLEYREAKIPLAGGGFFSIPANVRLIGTMNTADRSIALVDHALRRRFAFLHLPPNFEVLRRFHQDKATGFPVELLIAELGKLNKQINDPNYAVGISFFLRPRLQDEIADIWQMEIEPYLEEYFFDRVEAVKEFRWEQLREKLGL